MTPRTIKRIDFWAGVPLCFLLSVYAWLQRIVAPARGLFVRPHKILFLKLIEQGATVLAYPSLVRAVDLVGGSNVYFCVFAEHRPILDVLGIVPPGNVFEIRQRNLLVFLWDTLRFLVAARRVGIDAVVDMEFFSRASALLCYLSGAGTRVGYHRYTSEYPYRGNLMTHRVQYNPYLHTARAYLLLVESLTRPPSDTPLPKFEAESGPLPIPRFNPTEEQRCRVERLLAGARRPILIVNPNASDMLPLRRWPSGNVVELVRRSLQDGDAGTIVITGSESERDAVQRMFGRLASDRILNLAGRTEFVDLITLYCLADVMVTNDSGPAHFATLADLPCVVLFGPETPRLFSPIGRQVRVVYAKLACSPCVNAFNHRFSPCADNLCMKAISVDTVLAEIRHILAATGAEMTGSSRADGPH